MNKKILLKTLLPISVVALLGGGIASSLILTSCGSKKDLVLKFEDKDEVSSYLAKNQRDLSHNFTQLSDSGYSGEILATSSKIDNGSRICKINFPNNSLGSSYWYMSFGVSDDRLVLECITYNQLNITWKKDGQTDVVYTLYNGFSFASTFDGSSNFYFLNDSENCTLTFSNNYSIVHSKYNVGAASTSINASFSHPDVSYYDKVDHEQMINWLDSKQSAINLSLFLFLYRTMLISPFDIVISETKLGHTHIFNLSAYYYFGDTLSEIGGEFEYVPGVSIVYSYTDAPNVKTINFGQFIKPTFSTVFDGSGYVVEGNESRFFSYIGYDYAYNFGDAIKCYYFFFESKVDTGENSVLGFVN